MDNVAITEQYPNRANGHVRHDQVEWEEKVGVNRVKEILQNGQGFEVDEEIRERTEVGRRPVFAK